MFKSFDMVFIDDISYKFDVYVGERLFDVRSRVVLFNIG